MPIDSATEYQPDDAPARKPRGPSARQVEKNARVREALLKAAMKVVGKTGYARASIAKIAETAGVSTGTFYLHFASREELFDHLLPWANGALTAFIVRRVADEHCYMDFEERNIRGFFDYVGRNQAFLTVMIEAQFAAPNAWSAYVEAREASYLERLEAAWARGEFPDYARAELPQICTMMIALRREIVFRFYARPARERGDPEAAIATYLTFVFGALHTRNREAIAVTWSGPASARRVAA